MEVKQAQENAKKNLQTLINRCWEDEAFKQELINNPAKAIEKISGKPFDSKGKKVVVTDQTNPAEFHINIPVDPSNMELTEEELELVAGGAFDLELGWTFICVSWD